MTFTFKAVEQLKRLFSKRPNTIVTGRGGVVVLIATLLVAGPVRQSSDIVASVVSYILLSAIAILGLLSFLKGRSSRRRLSLRIVADPSRATYAGQRCDCVIVIGGVQTLPFFKTEVVLTFPDDRVSPIIIDLVGSFGEETPVSYTLTFPHRGEWEVSQAKVHIGDLFNLTRYSFTARATNSTIKVYPKIENSKSFPLIASASVPGDLIHDQHRRDGDPFDLKTYHPSDGMNRIVWKIYAKSGELFSRYPEPSHTPSGEIAMFVIADKEEDHVCSASLRYIEAATSAGIEIIFGTEGSSALTSRSGEASELLIQAAWSKRGKQELANDLNRFLNELNERSGGRNVERVVVFAPVERYYDKWSETLGLVGEIIAARGIAPVFLLVKRNESGDAVTKKRSVESYLSSLFLAQEREAAFREEKISEPFLQRCLKSHWQVEI